MAEFAKMHVSALPASVADHLHTAVQTAPSRRKRDCTLWVDSKSENGTQTIDTADLCRSLCE